MARRFERAAGVVGVVLGVVAGPAGAESSRVETSVSADVSYTDNARLERSGGVSDWVLSVRPRIRVERDSGRLNARVDYAIDGTVHGRSGVGSRSFNSLNAAATLEAVDNFLFIDGRASVQGENLSVFAPMAIDNLTGSSNRAEVRTYALSPYIRGVIGSSLNYSARVDWRTLDADASSFRRSSNTRINASLSQALPGTRFSWSVAADSSVNQYAERDDLRNETLRARVDYGVTADASVFATLGREGYNYVAGESSRRMQGAGLRYSPGPRTTFSAERESRFFGSYKAVRLSHRMPLLAGSIDYSRDLSSSNQQVFDARDGNVFQALFDLYGSRIPDPLERFRAVVDFLDKSGIPPFLARPFAYYTEQPFVDRRLAGTLVWLGARNSIGLSGYRSRRDALATGFALLDDFAFGRSIETRGVALDWRQFITPVSSLSLTLNQSHARAVDGTANTRNRSAMVGVQSPLSARSSAFASLRHNRGEGTTEFRENAMVTGVRITF